MKPLAAAAERNRGKPGRPRKATPPDVEMPTFPPRLLDIVGAAHYLSVSEWTIRDLVGNGTLPRVRVPLPNNGELRRVLLDRSDLDRLVEVWKENGR